MVRLYDLYFSDSPGRDKIRRIREKIEAAVRNGEIEICDCGPLKIALDRRNQGLIRLFSTASAVNKGAKSSRFQFARWNRIARRELIT